MLDGEAEDLARKAVELALAGDAAALRLCLDRIVARAAGFGRFARNPQRGRYRRCNSSADRRCDPAEITAGQAFALSQTVETYLRAIDATEFERRLRKLEEEDAAEENERYRY